MITALKFASGSKLSLTNHPRTLLSSLSPCSLLRSSCFLSVPQGSHTDGCFSFQVFSQTVTTSPAFSIHTKAGPCWPHTASHRHLSSCRSRGTRGEAVLLPCHHHPPHPTLPAATSRLQASSLSSPRASPHTPFLSPRHEQGQAHMPQPPPSLLPWPAAFGRLSEQRARCSPAQQDGTELKNITLGTRRAA